MAVLVLGLVMLLSMASHSDATYCVCNTGLTDPVLQRDIDYACGAGADCSAIIQNGACYNPNTVHDHCNYAVNSYYQRRAQVNGSCDFSGTATIVVTAPTGVASGCVYQSSPSNGGGGGGSTTPAPPGGGFPMVPPGGGGGVIGIAPSGTTFDNLATSTLLSLSNIFMLMFLSLTLLLFGFE